MYSLGSDNLGIDKGPPKKGGFYNRYEDHHCDCLRRTGPDPHLELISTISTASTTFTISTVSTISTTLTT